MFRLRGGVRPCRPSPACRPCPSHLVVLGPMYDVVDDEALTHRILRGRVVAACRVAHLPVLHAAVVVARHDLVQDAVPAGGVT